MQATISSADWSALCRLSDTAGLVVSLADFRGHRVLWEGALPYVTVDHQIPDLPEEGAAQPHGPLWLPLGPRTLVGEVQQVAFRGGVELSADFAAGPFQYTQMWRFHDDGRLEPWLTIHGPGLNDHHTYHPHWRFDFDVNGPTGDAIEVARDGGFDRINAEGWFPASAQPGEAGPAWRQVDLASGAAVSIRPNAWEDAELFAIRRHEGEWGPFYPHSADGEQPFPAAYLGDESIDGEDIALWYVAHVHFSAGFPFTAGPRIRVNGF